MQLLERLIATFFFAVGSHFRRYALEWCAALVIFLSFGYSFALLFAPPPGFPGGATIVIKQGSAVPKIAAELGEAGVIAHPRVFTFLLRASGLDTGIQAGPYRFAAPENALTVAFRLLAGDSGIPDIRITFIEGETVRQMAAKAAKAFPEITKSDFIAAAGPYEGELFPDTYRFAPSATAEQVVEALRANFDKRVGALSPPLSDSPYPLHDILVMASIVQAEVADGEEQRVVAGVLWNRIEKGMPLQVDATFGYLSDRNEYAPSLSDLKIDSPYNTYKYKGLPPTPIGNPGISAIKAAAFPAGTKYLFYITGKDGLMHYATTYAGHLANIRAYSTLK
jgi:UPF0755 protein